MTQIEYLNNKVKALEELVMSLIDKIENSDKQVALTYELLQEQIDKIGANNEKNIN